MDPLDLFTALRRELRFPVTHAKRTDYIRGGAVAFSALTLIGLPTFIGYLLFLAKAQLKGAEFLPPLDPELIGDYTYNGAKFLSYTLLLLGVGISVSWGILELALPTTVTGVLLLVVICNIVYFYPLSFIYYAKTGSPIPTSRAEVEGFYRTVLSYEYMTAILLFIFGGLILGTVLLIVSIVIVTVPLVLIGVWVLSVSFVRALGYSVITADNL